MKVVVLCLFMSLTVCRVFAQKDAEPTVSKTSFTLAAIYANNVSYYGQSTAEKLPYLLVNATARLPIGIYFSLGGYKLLNIAGAVSEADFGLGYGFDLNTEASLDISYIRSVFPRSSPLLQAANTNNINLTADYSWPWFKSSLSGDYAFGKENDVFIGLTNSKDISLGNLFGQEDELSITPSLEIVGGTQRYYISYQQEKIKRNNGKGKSSSNGNAKIETVTIPKSNFNLLSYNARLPISYARSSYLAELAYQFSVIGSNVTTLAEKQQSFISLSFYHQF